MESHKALFLDRDGVINVDTGYVHLSGDFRLIPGVVELCRAAQSAGYLIVVVTNQSGIGRGMFSEAVFGELCVYMTKLFESQGVRIAAIYHCPSADDADGDRKPNPGLFLKAAADLHLNLSECVGVGDNERDVVAGVRAGVKVNFLYSQQEGVTAAVARVASLTDIIPLLP